MGKHGLNWSGAGLGQVVGTRNRGSESSGSTKAGELPGQTTIDCELPRKCFASYSCVVVRRYV